MAHYVHLLVIHIPIYIWIALTCYMVQGFLSIEVIKVQCYDEIIMMMMMMLMIMVVNLGIMFYHI